MKTRISITNSETPTTCLSDSYRFGSSIHRGQQFAARYTRYTQPAFQIQSGRFLHLRNFSTTHSYANHHAAKQQLPHETRDQKPNARTYWYDACGNSR